MKSILSSWYIFCAALAVTFLPTSIRDHNGVVVRMDRGGYFEAIRGRSRDANVCRNLAQSLDIIWLGSLCAIIAGGIIYSIGVLSSSQSWLAIGEAIAVLLITWLGGFWVCGYFIRTSVVEHLPLFMLRHRRCPACAHIINSNTITRTRMIQCAECGAKWESPA
jgi:hypothetical protein